MSRRAMTLRRALFGLSAVGLGIVGVSSASATSPPKEPSAIALSVPLTSSFTSSNGTFATLAMGRLGEEENTFWQQAILASGSSKWIVKTPPGVASNGGLVIAPYRQGSVVGFEPSQLLRFSPLSALPTVDGSFTPGVLPVDLADVPDALTPTGFDTVIALTREGSVLQSTTGLSGWSTLVSPIELGANIADGNCGGMVLTAVAEYRTVSSPMIVGASCIKGTNIGIFQWEQGTLHLIGPKVASRVSTTKVMRLWTSGNEIAALIANRTKGLTTLVVKRAKSSVGPWTSSSSLVVTKGERIISTGELSTGSMYVEHEANGTLSASVMTSTNHAWTKVNGLPKSTAVLAQGPKNSLFALVPSGKNLLVYQQMADQQHFSLHQTVAVPIQYGSSN